VPLVVSVSGRVQRPGLVEVPAGARVADVLHAAGGALPGTDLAGVNLARRVVDGEQVAVGVPPAPDAVPAAGAGGPLPPGPARPGAPPGRVDLNTATVEQLDALPGVGPVTAQRILEWRTRHGRFARVEQLREIEGIGERRFGQLRELVRV
jgi:competence protein ComEA